MWLNICTISLASARVLSFYHWVLWVMTSSIVAPLTPIGILVRPTGPGVHNPISGVCVGNTRFPGVGFGLCTHSHNM